MPALHRWVGNPLLSFLGRIFFRAELGDFHCGLRGFNTSAIRDLKLRSHGMEFASEMVVRCRLARMRIAEVPTTLKKDGRSRRPVGYSFIQGSHSYSSTLRRRIFDPSSPWSGLHHAEHQSRHSHVSG